jgi:hypothetical protein
MRPHTVHALAQLLRHTRGIVTTIEKWAWNTRPDEFASEIREAIFLVRGALADMNNTIGSLQLEDESHRSDARSEQ